MHFWRTRCLLICTFFNAVLLSASSLEEQSIQSKVHKDLFGPRGLFISNLNFQNSFVHTFNTVRTPQEQAELIVSAIELEKIKGLKFKARFLKRRLTKDPKYKAEFLEQLEESIKNGTDLKERLESKRNKQSFHQEAWQKRMQMGDETLFLWMGSTLGSMVAAGSLGPVLGPTVVLSTFVFSLFHRPIFRYKLTQTSGREYKTSIKDVKAEVPKISSLVNQVLTQKTKIDARPDFIELATLPDESVLSVSRKQFSAALNFRNTLPIYRSLTSNNSAPSLYSEILVPHTLRRTEESEFQEAKEGKLLEFLKLSLQSPNPEICLSAMRDVAPPMNHQNPNVNPN